MIDNNTRWESTVGAYEEDYDEEGNFKKNKNSTSFAIGGQIYALWTNEGSCSNFSLELLVLFFVPPPRFEASSLSLRLRK